MSTDMQLRQDVERELSWDPGLDARNVAVTAQSGVVTLTGHVNSYHAKMEAERIAKRVYGVTGIANDIEVDWPGTKKLLDADLVQAVLAALKWNAAVPASKLKPIVRDGWLTLEGKVDWFYQKREAENAVRSLSGIRGVTNNIMIESDVVPQRVSEKITEALTRNAQLDARRISVLAQDHKVTLSGSVRSWAERDDAETAAWAAPGITAVENHIRVTA